LDKYEKEAPATPFRQRLVTTVEVAELDIEHAVVGARHGHSIGSSRIHCGTRTGPDLWAPQTAAATGAA
jgi:hypothetical protein